MFVQVIKGRTEDRAALEAQCQAWRDEVRPGAIGYLGGTVGVADDGTFIAIARFADEGSARANADRPEQTAWWQATAPLFVGEPSFRESTDVATMFGGGSNDAGFVQVMEGRALDRAKAEAFETPELEAQLRAARPDLLGSLRVWLDGNAFVEAAYFTTEEAAREGEASDDFAGPQEDYSSLFTDMTYIDLRSPMLD